MMNSVIQIIFAVLALSLLIAWHEFGHYLFARLTGMRVLQFSIGFGPKLLGFTRKGIEYRIGALPIGGYVQIAGMTDLEEDASKDPKSFVNRPYWAQMATIAAGPIFNYMMAFVLFFCVFWSFSADPRPGIILGSVATGSAAQEAGVQPGDILLKMNGQPVMQTADFLQRIQASKGEGIPLEIRRGASDLALTVFPKPDSSSIYRLGVGGFFPVDLTFSGALQESAANLWNQSVQILGQLGSAIAKLFTNIWKRIFSDSSVSILGDIGLQLGGPIQITRDLSNSATLGIKNLLGMLASLSLVLGLFNLLPIPSLDGSKILFLSIEKAIRRKISAKIQIAVHLVGIAFILGLMLILTVFDVLRIYNAS